MSDINEGNVSAVINQMNTQAEDDAKTAKALDSEIAIATHRKEAIKAIPGDITFQVDDSEEKDPETGKLRAQTFRLARETARDLWTMQGVTNGVYGYLRRVEPHVSDTFGAPECYSDPKSTAYKGLTKGLEKTSSKFRLASDEESKLLAKGVRNLTDQESVLLESYRTVQKKARYTMQQVRNTLKKYYEEGLVTGEATPGRKQKSVDALISEYINTLFKRSQSSKASVSDKGTASLARDWLLLIQSHPKDAERMLLAFNYERKAKPKEAAEVAPKLEPVTTPTSEQVQSAIAAAEQKAKDDAEKASLTS